MAWVHVSSWRSTYRGLLPDGYLDRLRESVYTERWARMLERLASNHGIYVAEEDGRVVGFAYGGPDRDRSRRHPGELYAIYLVEDSQRRGWGRMLVEEVAAHLLAHRMRGMVVWVLRDNRRARAFYEHMGGVLLRGRMLDFDGLSVPEVSYGWDDVTALAARAAAAG
jgi:GNAT superfamily N-acetyltransferase